MKIYSIIFLLFYFCSTALGVVNLYPSINEGHIDGTSSNKINLDTIKLGSNGGPQTGIYAPLASFNISFDDAPTAIQSIDLSITIQSYGSGFGFYSPITASILVNNAISSDFNELSFQTGAFSEDIDWFTNNGWIDTGADYFFPTNNDILSIGTELTTDVTTSLSQMILGNNNSELAFIILADNYNGANLTLGNSSNGGFESPTLIIDYSAVPEPSTYALILGALVLGFVALRRK